MPKVTLAMCLYFLPLKPKPQHLAIVNRMLASILSGSGNNGIGTGGQIRFVQQPSPLKYSESDERDFDTFYQKLDEFYLNTTGLTIEQGDTKSILLNHLDTNLLKK